jgi:hypothetical protein
VIQVPRQSTRTKKSRQQAKPGHVQRSATVALRYLDIELRPEVYQKDKAPIKLTVVHAQQILRWYCLRWRIED